MKMFVFDTDGLIKLARSGILSSVPYQILISTSVYQEAVTAGKKRLYEDALVIEQLIGRGKILVKEVKNILNIPKLGAGETSALILYYKMKADAIVSDDRQFLTYLGEQNIPFLVPSEFLVLLALAKQIKNKDCLQALDTIKNMITVENYYSAKEALED